jgi:hypothetical protein
LCYCNDGEQAARRYRHYDLLYHFHSFRPSFDRLISFSPVHAEIEGRTGHECDIFLPNGGVDD